MKIFLIAWLCAGGVSVFLFWLAGRKTKTRPTIARIIAHVLAIMGGVVYLIVAVVVLLRSRDEAIIL